MEVLPLPKLLDLSGKTALVTGGAMGIGRGVAERFAEAGANVLIADTDGAAAESAVNAMREKGYKAAAVLCDVASAPAVRAAVDLAVSTFGSLDILVNNAGIYPMIPVMNMTEEDLDRVLSVNLKGVFLMTKIAAERMITQGTGGRIINMASVDALHPSLIGLAAYDASKHGVWGFTKNVALELAPHKIWVNAIAPGAINTPGIGAGHMTKEQEERVRPLIERIPMKRNGEPDEIGNVALFLASDMASYMTGSLIVADGGVLLT